MRIQPAVHPGNRGVHHANIRIDRTPASRELDTADPAPGYEGTILRSADYPDGHFLGWTPGQLTPLAPRGLSWRLEAGADLVVQLHLQPTGKTERIQPSVADQVTQSNSISGTRRGPGNDSTLNWGIFFNRACLVWRADCGSVREQT